MEILLLISLIVLVFGAFWFTTGTGSDYAGSKFEEFEDKKGFIRNNH